MSSKDIRGILCSFSDRSLDASMFPLIQKWNDPPTAIQVLEVLDLCIHASLASDFIIFALQVQYDNSLKNEGTTHEQIVVNAHWRTTKGNV